MGSSGGKPLPIKRLKNGLKQLTQYLQESPKPVHATLVVYDGRAETEFEALAAVDAPIDGMKCLEECEKVKVPPGGSCFVFFLYSERASEL